MPLTDTDRSSKNIDYTLIFVTDTIIMALKNENLPVNCVNCGSPASMVLEDQEIISSIQEWIAPRLVQAHDLVCTVCLSQARAVANTRDLYHIGKYCTLCQSILTQRSRSHQIISLRIDTQHHINIKNIILERLQSLEVCASHHICHPCWQKVDRAARRYSSPSTFTALQLNCANCHINVTRMRRHILSNESILMKVQQRVAPKVVSANDYICDACNTIFMDVKMESDNTAHYVGHYNVCIKCGRSVVGRQHHYVLAERRQNVLNILQNWIQPQEIQSSDVICHKCFVKAETTAQAGTVASSHKVSQETEKITLPNYSRAPDTHARCIFPTCSSRSQQMVPLITRVMLFSNHKYYIPPNCRICNFHLKNQLWSQLFESENRINSFAAAHIEDFCELLKK